MQEMEKIISLYHTGFLVCFVLFIVFLLTTVLMFLKFDIQNVIDLRTGRGAKRTIQKMEEINAKTGKLRHEMVVQTPSVLRPEERIVFPPTEKNLKAQPQVTEEMMGTSVLQSVSKDDYSKNQAHRELPGAFRIVKDNMWIHTDETI